MLANWGNLEEKATFDRLTRLAELLSHDNDLFIFTFVELVAKRTEAPFCLLSYLERKIEGEYLNEENVKKKVEKSKKNKIEEKIMKRVVRIR